MPRSYRSYQASRQRRSRNGRFRHATLQDFGISASEVADGDMTCADCGHVWRPVLKAGHCPACDSTRKAAHGTGPTSPPPDPPEMPRSEADIKEMERRNRRRLLGEE